MATAGKGDVQGIPLFDRRMNLVIGFPASPTQNIKVPFNTSNALGRDLSGFDVDFTVEKSLKATEPNTCLIEIFNLNPDSRQSLSGAGKLTVKLDAGYKDQVGQIFFAEAHAAWTTRKDANYVTRIESADTIARPTGIKNSKKAQPGSIGNVTKTFGAYVPVKQAFDAIVEQLGVDRGNLTQAMAGAAQISVRTAALIGNAGDRMTDLCRSAGLEWSIQDGVLQILNIGQALSSTKAIEISADTGMIDSPSVDSQGVVQVKTLLIPGLQPGALVSIDSLFVQKGGYRIEKIRYQGSTYDQAWWAEMDCVKY